MKKATVNHLAKHLHSASRVLMRADFNVPIKDKQVVDINRIKSKNSTIQAPFPPLKNYSTTTPNRWSSSPIKAGPTENATSVTLCAL
jgi:PAB1-binding protein PBP1